jgi:hypothetical protein
MPVDVVDGILELDFETRCLNERILEEMKSIMASKRNIGKEILEGMREIKRGEYGRVTTIPSVGRSRHSPPAPTNPRPNLSPQRGGMSCAVHRQNPHG